MLDVRPSRKDIHTRFRSYAVVALVLSVVSVNTANAGYRLNSGDLLAISVFGKSDLNRRVTVDVDGNIALPLIGEVRATGLSLAELRSAIKDLLVARDAVREADIAVEIVEYRPVYIYGHVPRAGAYPYRPGMTVRHALALAGGLQSGSASAPPTLSAELRGRYKVLSNELVRKQLRAVALEAEAEGATELDPSKLAQISRLQSNISELTKLETSYLKAQFAEREKETQHLRTAVSLADNQIAALEQAQGQDEQAAKQQEEELSKVTELSRKGLAIGGRLAEEQRATVLIKSRELNTKAQLALARQARESLRRLLEKADDRQLRIPRELQNANAAVEETRLQLRAISEQLMVSDGSGPQLEGNGIIAPEIAIFRKKDGATVKLPANEDTEIEPDDVIELTVGVDVRATPAQN